MPAPESGKSTAAKPSPLDGAASQPDAPRQDTPSIESDLAALAAKFAAHGGGSFSPQFSADLALEIVLNEIVEQACMATGASGAAIVLQRDGEMVCRACSGSTVPQLGSRLDDGWGISRECIRTRLMQKCDDAQADPRADMDASRSLGVRSVVVLPLLRHGNLSGLLEVFSTRAAAFGEGDERTLEGLAQRILQNLEVAAGPISAPAERPHVPLPSFAQLSPEATYQADPWFVESAGAIASGRGIEVLTWALGLTVMACALLFGVLVMQRLGWLTAREHPARVLSTVPSARGGAPFTNNAVNDSGKATSPASSAATTAVGSANDGATSSQEPVNSPKASSQDSVPPVGGLKVYENGREVFRLPVAKGSAESPDSARRSGVQTASSVESAGTMELPAAAAENGVLYRVEPDYPEEALRQGVQGAVVLEVHINPDGAVQELKLVSGPPLLAQAAVDAVKQWRFKPHLVKGHLVEMQTVVTLNFRLPH
jgi:TonB family protein